MALLLIQCIQYFTLVMSPHVSHLKPNVSTGLKQILITMVEMVLISNTNFYPTEINEIKEVSPL